MRAVFIGLAFFSSTCYGFGSGDNQDDPQDDIDKPDVSDLEALTALFLTANREQANAFNAGPILGRSGMASRANPNMKIFDWKRRGEPLPALDDSLNLGNLKVAPGFKKRKTRKGRGIAAGQGASCGFGMRGQKARSGRSTRPGFESGCIPVFRRLGKWRLTGRPFKGHTKEEFTLIKLSHLNSMPDNSEVDYQTLFEKGHITKVNKKRNIFKVVGNKPSELPDGLTAKGLTVMAHASTSGARKAISAAGGKLVYVSKTTGKVLDPQPTFDDDDEA